MIANRIDIASPEALMRMYYAGPSTWVKVSVRSDAPEKGLYEITLIDEMGGDDSVAEIRIVMFAHRDGPSWIVTEIRESWRCNEGRGHTGAPNNATSLKKPLVFSSRFLSSGN